MLVGVAKETAAGERRVALVPDGVSRLAESGVDVAVEKGAGTDASFADEAYEAGGARIRESVLGEADVVCKVQKPSSDEIRRLREGSTLIGLLQPLVNAELAQALAERGVTSFSMDSIPRITRAQPMDALSS